MKGDFSRIRFNPAKQYTSVLQQQGRVDLDADANEQCFIDEKLRDTINLDVIGRYGCPENSPGFAIRVNAEGDILIGPGRYYVNGILVENPAWQLYDGQTYLVQPASASQELLSQLLQFGSSASVGVVLEVWQRLITALDDPCLLEPALGQADTTARLQTVWRVVGTVNSGSSQDQNLSQAQTNAPATLGRKSAINTKVAVNKKSPINKQLSNVASPKPQAAVGTVDINVGKVFNVGDQPTAFDPISELSPCCQNLYSGDGLQHTGSMEVTLAQGTDCGCQPVAAAGYQGLENQLYRVEIHQGGDLTSATFKWSRENASVVTAVTSVGANSPIITVASVGPDANLGFQPGQWVELTDDSYQFGEPPNQPGPLFQIQSINQATLQVTMTVPVFGIDTTLNARMRRWDQVGDSLTAAGIPVSSTSIPLENGILVDFRAGQYQAGDFWLIPARTASGQIDWPPCGGNGNQYQPASWTRVYRAPLACISLRTETSLSTAKKTGINLTAEGRFLISDCRLFFPPLIAVPSATIPAALHVSQVTWRNDDIMTVDTLLANGLSVTFDQPTTCPWGGGNFQVTLEPPLNPGDAFALAEGQLPGATLPTFPSPAGTDSFMRTVNALDPPYGITVAGNQVSWITPAPGPGGQFDYAAYFVWYYLNTLLFWTNPIGYARVRIRLIGGGVYGTDASGNNVYLDGQSFGTNTSRSLDGSLCVSLNTPSGNALNVSDYEGWFYLAPTVYIASVVIQGLDANANVIVNPLTTVTVLVNANNQVSGLQSGGTNIASIQASIALTYVPVSPVTVNPSFSGPGTGTVVSIASSVQIPAGQQTFTTPISILASPGANVTDTVTLSAAVSILGISYPVAQPPTLAIVGPPQAQAPTRPTPPPPPNFPGGVPGKIASGLIK